MDASDARPPARHSDRFAGRVFLVAAVVAIGLVLYQLSAAFLLIAGAVIVAVIIHLLADPLHNHMKLGRKPATALAIFIFFVLIAGFFYFFGREAVRQFETLIEELPGAIESVRQAIAGSPLGQRLGDLVAPGGANAGDIFSYLRGAIGGAVSVVFYLILAITVGIVFAINPGGYRDGTLLLLPRRFRPRVKSAADASGRALKGWLVGQLIAMSIIGVLTSIGLMLIGMPSWLALGVLAGLAQFVPVVGPFASALPGLIVAASIDGSMLLRALAVYVGVQQLESNLITPFVMRKAASLPMALTLVSIIAFGALFGVAGAIVATPVTVAIYVLVQKLYVEDVLGEDLDVIGDR